MRISTTQHFRLNRLYLLFPLLLSLVLAPATSMAEEITIGAILPISGTHATIGHMQRNSMLMAVEDINSRGGINGQELVLDVRDSGGRIRDARAIIDHFVQDKQYPVVLAGSSSRVSASLAEKCEARRIPVVIFTGSEDSITLQDYRYVFRIAPPRTSYPLAVLQHSGLVAQGGKIVLITERSAYGDSMERTVDQVARGRGWSVSRQWKFDTGASNLETLSEGAAAAEPDAVFLVAFPPEGSRIIGDLKKRIPDVPVFNLIPASMMKRDYTRCGVSCDGVMNPSLWWPYVNRSGTIYRDKYQARFVKEPDYHGAQAYAAVIMAAQAIRKSGSVNPSLVRQALEGLAVDTPYGRVSFRHWNGFTNQNDPANHLVKWNGKNFELVWTQSQ